MNYSAVLFDLDGTLVDTAPDFIRIIQQLCQIHQHPCPSDQKIREQVSAGAKAMVKLLFGESFANVSDDDPQLLFYRQQFLEAYANQICVDSHLFDSLDDLLTQIEAKGVAWGIVTNKPRGLTESLLQALDLANRCAVLVCPDDVTHPKPHPEPLLLACQQLNILPQQCIYVGDHIRDIQAGQNAHMTTILAAYGYIPPEHQDLSTWGADYTVNTANELTHLLLQMLR